MSDARQADYAHDAERHRQRPTDSDIAALRERCARLERALYAIISGGEPWAKKRAEAALGIGDGT